MKLNKTYIINNDDNKLHMESQNSNIKITSKSN